MDGTSEVIPPKETGVTWNPPGDRVYRLSMLTVEDWTEIENEIRKVRPDPISTGLRIIAGLEHREDKIPILNAMWDGARRDYIVTQKEIYDWTTTVRGSTFSLWRTCLNHHPEMTLETVRSMIRPNAAAGRQISHDEICELIDQLHGMPPTGPT